MRHNLFLYMVLSVLSCLFSAQAMDAVPNEQTKQAALVELNEIVDSIALPRYDEKDMFLVPKPLPQLTGKAGFFENIPPTFILQMLQHLSLGGIYNVGETCIYLHAFVRAPGLTLNPYCLQPGIPQAMPLALLQKKTLNTPGGILMLAAHLSVGPQELRGWFLPGDLERALQQCPPLPATPEGMSDDEILRLIPQLKVTIAVLGADNSSERGVYVKSFLSQISTPTGRRLLGCSPLDQGIVYSLINYCHPSGWADMLPVHFYNLCELGDYTYERHVTGDVMACTLLRNPKLVPQILGCYMRSRPHLRPKALQLLQWCWTNRSIQSFRLGHMGAPTQEVELMLANATLEICESLPKTKIPPVIPEILRSLIFSPNGNDLHVWISKGRAIELCDDNPWVKREAAAFARFLLDFWQRDREQWDFNLGDNFIAMDYQRKFFLKHVMHAGKNGLLNPAEIIDCIPGMYRDLVENPQMFGEPYDDLLEDLVAHQFLGLAEDLINRTLMQETPHFLPRIYKVSGFTRHLVRLNAERFVPLMKAAFDREYQNWSLSNRLEGQTQFLIGLMTSVNSEEHREYVSQTAVSICQQVGISEVKPDVYMELARLFYHAGNEELCHNYLQLWLKALEKNPLKQACILQELVDKGMKLFSWVDVKELDPQVLVELLASTNNV